MGKKRLVPGAVAVYLCNEGSGTTLRDYSGNGNHGALAAGDAAPTWTPYGLSFDGGDYVDCGAIRVGGVTQTADSLTLVVYFPAAVIPDGTSNYVVNFPASTSTTVMGYLLVGSASSGYAGEILSIVAKVGTVVYVTAWIDAARSIPAGWHTISMIWNGTNYDLVLDGEYLPVQVPTGIAGHAPKLTASHLLFGARQYNSTITPLLTATVRAATTHPYALSPAQEAQTVAYLRKRVGWPTSAPQYVLLGFDDGTESIYTDAYPILAAAGFPATNYVVGDKIGTAGYASAVQLAALDAAGWDIANHGKTHDLLVDMTLEEQIAEFSGGAAALDTLGLTRASHHLAYRGGTRNEDTPAAFIASGMLTGRTTSATKMIIPGIDWSLTAGAFAGTATNGVAAAEAVIEQAVAGEVIQYYWHTIDEDGGELGWTTAQFQEFVDYLTARNIQPITVTQLYAAVLAGRV